MESSAEAQRWMRQALRDLKAAEDSREDGNYEWACYQAHQAAEKALKALLHAHGHSAWGHTITELLGYLGKEHNVTRLEEGGRSLDRHYTASRYPNAYESGYPGLFYDDKTAREAVGTAGEIARWVGEKLRELGIRVD